MRLGILFSVLFFAAAAIAGERPNILLLTAEDISPEFFSCYDTRVAKTPNIDRLASQGAKFMRAFSHAPVCAPTRSGMMTGAIRRRSVRITCVRRC